MQAQAKTHLVDTTMFWSPTGGGVRRYLLAKQAWLARQPGWRHTIAVPGAPAGPGAWLDLPSWPLPGSGYRLPLAAGRIAGLLEALAPDLLEVGDPFCTARAALGAAQRLGVPALAYCHSNLEAMARLLARPAGRGAAARAARAARAYGRAVYGPFDSVVAPSQAMCRHLEHWGLRHVSCQPLGVDTAVFHPGCASRPWRTRMGWSDRTRLLVFAGRFAPEKHLDVLAAAVDRLGPPYALLAIGAGPAPPRGDRVRCLPFIAAEPGLAVALASADAFVHAGDQETFGLSALEALACGTPVVLRDSEGLADWVDERVGVGVPSGGAGAFAEAVAALFDDRRQPLPQRRLAARQRALAHDWAQVFPQMLARYRRLLHGAAAAGFEPAGTRAAR